EPDRCLRRTSRAEERKADHGATGPRNGWRDRARDGRVLRRRAVGRALSRGGHGRLAYQARCAHFAILRAPDRGRHTLDRGCTHTGTSEGQPGYRYGQTGLATAGGGALPLLRLRSEEHTSELQSRENLV